MLCLKERINEYENTLALILDIGEKMVFSGAEISRVEDTVTRLCKAYGAVKVDVFALTSVIFLTVSFGEGVVLSQTRRVVAGGQTDFIKLEKYNALSRKCCVAPMPLEELKAEIETISSAKISNFNTYVGSFLAAFGFVIFFGGNLIDASLSGVFALAICALADVFAPKIPNKVFYYFITSMIIGFGICAIAKYIPSLHADKIIIGDIMVLVPGIAFTRAVKNVLIGDTLSALVRLAECLVWTCALACGFIIPIAVLLGG